MKKKPKVAIITNMIAPYRIPLFNRLAKNNSIELKVFFEYERAGDRLWGIQKNSMKFDYSILRSIPINFSKNKFFSFNTIPKLVHYKPDVIIGGMFGVTYIQALVYSCITNAKYIMWGEMTEYSERNLGPLRRNLRRLFARLSNGAIAPSTETKTYFQKLGINNIVVSLLTVDQMGKKSRQFKSLPKNKDFYSILYVGSIEKIKGVDLLLKTFEKLEKITENRVKLNIVGNEKNEPDFLRRIEKFKRNPNIKFHGFQNDLSTYYKNADIFILPSREDTFGLVVAEAMSYGLPVVCSQYAGCHKDLIFDNGLVIDPNEVLKNAKRISELIDDPKRLKYMARKSLQIMNNNLNDSSVVKMVKIINEVKYN